MRKIVDFLSGVLMTIVGGISLVINLILYEFLNSEFPFEPAWIAVIICGVSQVYWAIWCVINNKGISKSTSSLLISIAMAASILIGDVFAAGEIAFIMAYWRNIRGKDHRTLEKGLKDFKALRLSRTQN